MNTTLNKLKFVELKDRKVTKGVGLMLQSFPDCPNHCTNGLLFDSRTMQNVVCPSCEEKRKTLARTDAVDKETGLALSELLHIRGLINKSMGLSFDETMVIDKKAKKYELEKSSVEDVEFVMKKLMTKISIGDTPASTIYLGLGQLIHPFLFMYPYLAKAYMTGLSVAPLVTSRDLELFLCDHGYSESFGCTLDDLFTRNVCILYIQSDADQRTITRLKMFIEQRALKGNSTLIVSAAYWSPALLMVLEDSEDCDVKATALNVSVVYKKSIHAQTSELEEDCVPYNHAQSKVAVKKKRKKKSVVETKQKTAEVQPRESEDVFRNIFSK